MESSTFRRVYSLLFIVDMIIVPIIRFLLYLLFYFYSLHSSSPLYSFIPKLFHGLHLLYEVRALFDKLFMLSSNLLCDSLEFQADSSHLFPKCDSLNWMSLVNFKLDI